MKIVIRCTLLVALFLLAACGYRNPYVYNGPDKTIYITDWKNRSSELGINTTLYQSLVRWFQKSGSLHISAERQGADLILAGEVKSVFFPSRSYGSNSVAVDGRMLMTVRYILKDLQSGAVLLEEQNHTFSQSYLISTDSSVTRDNEQTALNAAIEDLSQKVYQRCLVEIPKLEAKQQAAREAAQKTSSQPQGQPQSQQQPKQANEAPGK